MGVISEKSEWMVQKKRATTWLFLFKTDTKTRHTVASFYFLVF